jgi:spoIIIJ-associated protein
MEWVERTDRTVDAAKDFLLDQLGVDEDEAEFEVLEEPKPGLFGRVRGQARVRARVKPRAPRAKDERRRRPAKSSGGNSGGGSAGGGGRNGSRQQKPKQADAAPAKDATSAAPAPTEGTSGGGRSGGRNQGRGDRESAPAVDPAPFVEPVRTFLGELASAFGLAATVEVDVTDEGELEARIQGDGLGALIGPAGGVINAIQELSRTYLQKVAHGGSAPRLKVDVGGYRADRRTALAAYAREVAGTVIETGQSHAFEPMGSVDRKIVHDAAGEVDGVVTRSDGEDPSRRVVIAKA